MPLIVRTISVCSLLALWGGLHFSRIAQAQMPRVLAEEVREFEILVKGKPAGQNTITISETDDGLTRVSTEAAVKFDYLVYVYRYEFHGREIWRANRLAWVDNRAVDAGKQLRVRATIEGNGSTIEANGKAAIAGPLLGTTTSYWRLPDRVPGRNLSFLDADQGIVHAVSVDEVGTEEVVAAGRKLGCTHYRVRGGVAADLWFDGQNRLVRQTSVEEGYPTELRLTRLTTNNAFTARR
jgi:hypothetical protein